MDDKMWDSLLENDLDVGHIEITKDAGGQKENNEHFYTRYDVDYELERRGEAQEIDEKSPALNKVFVQGLLGQGVCDLIGGEVWEASLYMCSYLISRFGDSIVSSSTTTTTPIPEKVDSFLELGAGLGLPSFLLLNMYRQRGAPIDLHITDYDYELMQNLDATFMRWVSRIGSPTKKCTANGALKCAATGTNCDTQGCTEFPPNLITRSASAATVSIMSLDWNIFQNQENNSTDTDNNGDIKLPFNFSSYPELLFGSALCYSHYHSSLADTIRHFLLKGTKEFVCIQRRDRPGFDSFLARLEILELKYTIESLPKDIIDYSKLIVMESEAITSLSSSKNSIIRMKHFLFPQMNNLRSTSNNKDIKYIISNCFHDGNSNSNKKNDDTTEMKGSFAYSQDTSVFVILKVVT